MSWQDIEVRRLERADKSRWRELWDAYQAFFRSTVPGIVTQTAWDRMMDADEPLFGLCAMLEDGHMAGIVHCSLSLSTWTVGPHVHMLDLYVAEGARGHGVGRALVEGVYREADLMGAHQVFWHAPQADFRAKLLYRKVAVSEPTMIRYMRKKWDW